LRPPLPGPVAVPVDHASPPSLAGDGQRLDWGALRLTGEPFAPIARDRWSHATQSRARSDPKNQSRQGVNRSSPRAFRRREGCHLRPACRHADRDMQGMEPAKARQFRTRGKGPAASRSADLIAADHEVVMELGLRVCSTAPIPGREPKADLAIPESSCSPPGWAQTAA